jgi:hypothetical protein
MALDSQEQDFMDFALAALPRWMRSDDVFLRGAAKMFGQVRAQSDYWFGQTLISDATGPTTGQPDWLNQHARDRGTSRQNGESDQALRQRIRNVPDALTRDSLLAAANAILASESISGTVAMVELPRDGAFSGSWAAATSIGGTGGTFALGSSNQVLFTPTTLPWPVVPFRDPSVVRRVQNYKLVLSSATAPANDGAFSTVALLDNAAIFVNASGVAGTDPAVAWKVEKLDYRGNELDGFHMAYSGRGWRSSRARPPKIILILPYGSTASTQVSIQEMLRQKKAAGVTYVVERRLDP